MAYVRTVKTSSGATAVQIVWSSRKGSRSIEHLGSAHDDVELAALKAALVGEITVSTAHSLVTVPQGTRLRTQKRPERVSAAGREP